MGLERGDLRLQPGQQRRQLRLTETPFRRRIGEQFGPVHRQHRYVDQLTLNGGAHRFGQQLPHRRAVLRIEAPERVVIRTLVGRQPARRNLGAAEPFDGAGRALALHEPVQPGAEQHPVTVARRANRGGVQ